MTEKPESEQPSEASPEVAFPKPSEESPPEHLTAPAKEVEQPVAPAKEVEQLPVESQAAGDTPSSDPEPAKPVMELGALRALANRQKGHHSSQQSSPARPTFALPPSEDAEPMSVSRGVDHTSFLDDTSDGKVRHFDDLFSRYPIGDGEFQIYVERKIPKIYRGLHIGGMQKPIESVIDHSTFAARYGSGTYSLTVYGPLPRKGRGDDGQLKRKAYTRPIKVEVPDPFDENPPNPEMAAVAEAEEVEMGVYGVRRGGATDADAEIERAKLEHEQVKDERQWTRQERMRALEEKKQREREEAERAKELSQMSLMERMLASRDEEIRQLRNTPSKDVAALPFMPDLINAMKPQGPDKDALESERRHHVEELSRLRDGHNSEVHRIRDEHTKELERLRADVDKNLRDERERNERLMRDKEESARRQIEDARNEATRRVTELRESYEARLSDERRQHDRDLATAQSMNNNSSSTLTSSFEMRLEVKQQEINRLAQELSQVRAELEEEKGKTLADRVGEFAGAAEALGYSKEEGDKGWKEMLGEAAVGLVQNVPALASNITASLRGNQQQQVPMLPQRTQAGAGMVPQNYGPVFATDGVDMDLEYPRNPGPPIQPGQDPYAGMYEDEEEDEPQAQPQPQAAQVPSQGYAPPQGQVPPQTQSQTPPTPAQQQAIAQAQQDAQADPNSLNVSDDQIVEFSEMFRGALAQGASPEEFSQGMVAQLGPLMAGSIVREIPLKRVSTVLQGAPGGDKDPLVRRDGQKFLTKVWELVKARTKAAVAAE